MNAGEQRLAIWQLCEGYFRAALEYEQRPITLAAVRADYMAGGWHILRGTRSAVLLRVVTITGHRHLHGFLGGGDLGEMLAVLLPRAEILARSYGCRSLLIDGRKGWARVMAPLGFVTITKDEGWWMIAKPLPAPNLPQRVNPMTAINYSISPNYIAVAADTLATAAGDWFPAAFTAKAMAIPHLDALITSTTYMTLLRDCYNYALAGPVRDLADLADKLPTICRQTYAETMALCQALEEPGIDHSWSDCCAVTLFGWCDNRKRLVGIRFALKNDFAPELLPDGVYTQPEVLDAPTAITPANVLDLCSITRQQQEEESRVSPQDHNPIGGDVLLWELRADDSGGVTCRSQRVYRFHSFANDCALIEKALLE
jgi:hypothetical protein